MGRPDLARPDSGRLSLLLALALLLATGVVALVFALREAEPPTTEAAAVRPAATAEPAKAAEDTETPLRTAAPAESAQREEAPTPPADLNLQVVGPGPGGEDARFDGNGGQIRGYIETSDTTPFPSSWSLVLEPSTTLVGRERAERRVIEFQAGEQEFVIKDLPLAGYDLVPTAAGMNGRRHPVLLDRRRNNPYVTLQLYPAGMITGRVVDHEKLAAPGLQVTLEALTRESLLETVTDAIGNYRFDGVLDGEYRLKFGPPTSPILPAQELRFSAPTMTLPDKELPPLSRLELLVLGPDDLPVFNAAVKGAGTNGGLVDVTTDAMGQATALFLPPGRYRLTAQHELHKRTRRSFDVTDEPREFTFRLVAK